MTTAWVDWLATLDRGTLDALAELSDREGEIDIDPADPNADLLAFHGCNVADEDEVEGFAYLGRAQWYINPDLIRKPTQKENS